VIELRALLSRGLARCDGGALVRAALAEPSLRAALVPGSGGRVVVLALGKAASSMAHAAVEALGPCAGIVAGPGSAPEGLRSCPGEHPLPGPGSLAAGEALLATAAGCKPADVALLLISGGGSALAEAPVEGVGLDELRSFTAALLASGAPIEEVNLARRRLSRLKGGGLARALGTPRAVALVLADVEPAEPAVVASGPALPSPSEVPRPETISLAPVALRDALVRAPPPTARLVPHRVIGSPATLVAAVAREADAAGLPSIAWPVHERGPLPELVARLRDFTRGLLRGGGARLLVVGAEPSLVLPAGHGAGGRMQQLALALALELRGAPFRALAIGSDGQEAGGPHAGAAVDGGTIDRALALGLDPASALARCDAGPLLAAVGAAIPAHPTGTNLADVVLLQAPFDSASFPAP